MVCFELEIAFVISDIGQYVTCSMNSVLIVTKLISAA